MFVLTGPNTGLGHNSMVFMIESQLDYILDCLAVMEQRGIGAVDVRPETQAAYNERIQDELKGTVWSVGGCSSWYIDRHGRNSTLYPDFTFRFRRLTEHFDPADYTVEPRTPAREPAYA